MCYSTGLFLTIYCIHNTKIWHHAPDSEYVKILLSKLTSMRIHIMLEQVCFHKQYVIPNVNPTAIGNIWTMCNSVTPYSCPVVTVAVNCAHSFMCCPIARQSILLLYHPQGHTWWLCMSSSGQQWRSWLRHCHCQCHKTLSSWSDSKSYFFCSHSISLVVHSASKKKEYHKISFGAKRGQETKMTTLLS
jgi:hypothetical protein